jgi:hypothetical protein
MSGRVALFVMGFAFGGGLVAQAAVMADVPPPPSIDIAPPGTGGVMPTPGDAEAAIRSQFDSAEKQGTPAAWLLFAQRYPDHRLAREARRRAALAPEDR